MNPESFFRQLKSQDRELRYPKNIGEEGLHHFMIIREFKFHEATRTDTSLYSLQKGENVISSTSNENGNYEQVRSFILYLPQGSIKTGYESNYGEVTGFFGELVSRNVKDVVDTVKDAFSQYENSQQGVVGKTTDFYTSVGTNLYNAGKDAVNQVGMQQGIQFFKQNLLSAFGGLVSLGTEAKGEQLAALSMRSARNPYASLVFTGNKKLREHDFNYEFNPRSSDESIHVIKIISSLKQGMLPSLPRRNFNGEIVLTYEEEQTDEVQSNMQSPHSEPTTKRKKTYTNTAGMPSLFFKFPNVYTITFYDSNGNTNGNQYLYKIGQSVLQGLTVKYSQTYFKETGAPTSIGLQLKFKENFALSRQSVDKGY